MLMSIIFFRLKQLDENHQKDLGVNIKKYYHHGTYLYIEVIVLNSIYVKYRNLFDCDCR